MYDHWNLSLHEVIAYWSEIDKNGTHIPGIRSLCLTDRYYLLVKVCQRVDMLHPWIYERCREVERDPDDHLDLWAREHYKSTIITFGGAVQEILKNPEITIGIFSHVGAIASDFLKQIKTELEKNDILKRAFPDILYEDPQKQSTQWSVEGGITVKRKSNPKEATVEASGLVDGQPIGKHYFLRIYDDVVTDKSVNTPEQIQKTTSSFSLSQALGKEGGKQWVIGTRYSYADTYEWMLSKGSVKERIYPATDDGTADGNPVLFSQEYWENKKLNSTDADIACQFLQNPLSGQDRMFDVTNLQMYEVRPAVLNVYLLVDPARSKKKGSANTGMIVVGVDYAMNKYILDGFNHRMDLGERWDYMKRLYVRWCKAAGVHQIKVGYESFGAQADMDYFKEQMKKKGEPRFEIEELQWPRDTEGSKTDRVQRLVPDTKKKKIFLPYDTDPTKLTSNQRKMVQQGYDYRVAMPIRKKDDMGNIYDLSKHLRDQFHFFPFGGKKDLIDAFARIYDMEPRPPSYNEPSYAEPEIP